MAQRIEFPDGFDVLKRNGELVEALWHAVDHCSLNRVPAIVREVIISGAWRERKCRNKIYEHNTFLSFITAAPLAGCGWQPEKVEALIKDDAETLTMFRQATTGKKGAHHDNVMRTRQGNSRAYTLDRLQRERPDLFELTVAGKLSPNAAATKAGFRRKLTRFEQIKAWLPKLTDEERSELKAML